MLFFLFGATATYHSPSFPHYVCHWQDVRLLSSPTHTECSQEEPAPGISDAGFSLKRHTHTCTSKGLGWSLSNMCAHDNMTTLITHVIERAWQWHIYRRPALTHPTTWTSEPPLACAKRFDHPVFFKTCRNNGHFKGCKWHRSPAASCELANGSTEPSKGSGYSRLQPKVIYQRGDHVFYVFYFSSNDPIRSPDAIPTQCARLFRLCCAMRQPVVQLAR